MRHRTNKDLPGGKPWKSKEPQLRADKGLQLELESAVIRQYGRQIRKVALETLKRLGVRKGRVSIVDKGALDCTIKARVECAVMRAAEHEGRINWGGMIR